MDDAQDIFQEAIYLLIKKIINEELSLTCTFKTFLYSVCRNLWLQKLTKDKLTTNYQIIDYEGLEGTYYNPFDIPETSYEICLFKKHFRNLSDNCQKIIKLHMKEVSYETIANLMDLKSRRIAINSKYKCLKILLNSILNDPEFIENKLRLMDCLQYNFLKEKFHNGGLTTEELEFFREKMKFNKKFALEFLKRN